MNFPGQHPVPIIDASRMSAEVLRNRISSRFDVVNRTIRVAGTDFSLLKVRDTNELVDAIDPGVFAEDERLPYWADLWTSSIELARWCLQDAGLKGKRVLELGCGLGLAGIAAARAGAHVTFSDYEQDALDFSLYNALQNLESISERVAFVSLDWRNPPPLDTFDLIIAADVVYERRMFFPLMEALQALLRPGGFAVFTEPCRSIGQQFLHLLEEAEFHVTSESTTVELDGRTRSVIRSMIRLPRKGDL